MSSTGVSFACWFKFTASSGQSSRIFNFGNVNGYGSHSDGIGFSMLNHLVQLFACTSQGSCSYTRYLDANLVITDNVWRHAVWTVDSAGNWIGYINGKMNCAYSAVAPVTAVLRNFNYLGKSTSADPYLDGAIDEFYYFDTVLTAGQVMSLYQQGGACLPLELHLI